MIQITKAAEAEALLRDVDFLAKWQRLYERCPWATPFQSLAFAMTWYQVYRELYTPVLVNQLSADGELTGLLSLAVSASSQQLYVAGTHQAEYQVWLTSPQESNSFITDAIKRIYEEFPGQQLTFTYLPPSTPVDWIHPEHSLGRCCVLEPHQRPLMHIGDGSQIMASLKKKSNKSRLNRLKRYGEIRFEQIEDRTALGNIFDHIATCYDFRQAAAHQSHPFEDDPLKKAFHLALMESPGLVHMTVLYAGDTIAAANFGLAGFQEVNLGVFVQNPFFAKHSPGKFHVFMLGQELAKQGISTLDLTPGGDPWKERFATDHDDVALLTVYPTPGEAWSQKVREQAVSSAKQVLERLHLDPQSVKKVLGKMRQPQKSLQEFKKLWQHSEVRLYHMTADKLPRQEASLPMTKDSLEDLLTFRPVPGEQSRDEMLAHWLRRIEAGSHVYTYIEKDRFVFCGWLLEQPKAVFFPQVSQEATFPPDTVVFFDFYTHYQNQERGYYQMSLPQMLHDAGEIAYLYVAVPAENHRLRQVVEDLGFTYDYSLFSERRFGKHRQWTNRPDSEPQKQESL